MIVILCESRDSQPGPEDDEAPQDASFLDPNGSYLQVLT